MSSLTATDRRYLEHLLRMEGGLVLDFNDSTCGQFFRRHGIDIHGGKYNTSGTSKAKKMRAFWEQEPDAIVAIILSEMLDYYKAGRDISGQEVDSGVLEKCRAIVARLFGSSRDASGGETIENFLDKEFKFPNIHKLPIEPHVATIIESRLNEALKVLKAGAHLSVIFLCGSVLEGVLLGAAQKNPALFNRASSSPKNHDGKVKPFQEWTLAQFIEAAYELRLLNLDVRKFSHALRDFRNYIHPYEQVASGFMPDEHTAKVCFQVLKAALAGLAGDRK